MDSNDELADYLLSAGYVKSARVEGAFRKTDRGKFVPKTHLAYDDRPLPIGFGQTVSAPGVVAMTLEALGTREGDSILEIGTGSGYQTALLAILAGSKGTVHSVERVRELYERARNLLRGRENIVFHCADGSLGLAGKAPFDRICVSAACPRIPKPLEEQLADGGVLVAPVQSFFAQDLVRATKVKGMLEIEKLGGVVFVPLLGRFGYEDSLSFYRHA